MMGQQTGEPAAVAGCGRLASTVAEVDLPSTWAADRTFTTLSLHVGVCGRHLIVVTRRAEAMPEARAELVEPIELVDLMEGGPA